MFSKNISITDTLESHINSSSDEVGEDDSFDEFGKDSLENPSISEIKNRIAKYHNWKKKMENKKDELLRDKTISIWQSVYYIFFGNYKHGAVTLHELNFRCKFLFNMDKVYGFEKEIEKKKIKPLTNIDQFIKMYSLKKEKNLLESLLSDKAKKEDEDDLKIKELRKRIRDVKFLKKEENKSEKDGGKSDKKLGKSKSTNYMELNKEPTEKRYYLKSLLELNNFNLQDEELYDVIKELTNKYKENKDKQKLDNLTKIIRGDFIYKQELDNAMKLNDPFLNEYKYILDVNSERPFLIKNMDVDLIKKYEKNLKPQDRLSRQVNNFIDNVLSKLNPNFKIDD
jgi:hypothetical protein